MSDVRSVSSLAFARKQHPNTIKNDNQLASGLSVVTGELPGNGFCVVLTRTSQKYRNNSELRINSIHGYQTELPGRLEDRNKLCAYLVTQRGDPVIQCDGGHRKRFRREILPKLQLDDVKVEVRKWRGSSDRHIEDMFANMQRTKPVKVASDRDFEKTAVVTVSPARSSSTSNTQTVGRKRHAKETNILLKLFEKAKAKKNCCKESRLKDPIVLTSVDSDNHTIRTKADSPGSLTADDQTEKKSSDNENPSQESQTCDSDDLGTNKKLALKVLNNRKT